MKRNHFLIFFSLFSIVSIYFIYQFGMWHYTAIDALSAPDSYSYLEAAEKIKNHFEPDALRTYGYPLILLFFKSITPSNVSFLVCIYAFQLSILCIGFILIYKILCNYIQAGLALAVICGLSLHVSFYVYAFLIHTEIVFIFTMLLASFYLQKYYTTQHHTFIILSYFFFCIATLIRPGIYYLCILYSLATALFFIYKKSKYILLCIFIFISTIGFQVYQIHQYFGAYKISYIDDVANYRYLNNAVMVNANIPNIVEVHHQRNLFFDTLCYKKSEQNWALVHSMAKNDTKNLFDLYPKIYIKTFLQNIKDNYNTGNVFLRDLPVKYMRSTIVQHRMILFSKCINILMFWLLCYIIVLYGYLIISKKIPKPILYFTGYLLFYCFYQCFTSGISLGEGDRFNIVWQPICVLVFFVLQFYHTKKSNYTWL